MKFRYNEDVIINDLMEYIKSTYKKHYASGDGWPHLDGFQVNDLFMSLGMSQDVYVSNAIEYLARYGHKDGKNKKDLFKAIHNIVFLINNDFMKPKKVDVEPEMNSFDFPIDDRG